jgi:transcriptional regulator GlxA family with amidase domain
VEDTVDIVRTALRAVHDAASRPSARDGLTAAVAHMQSTRGHVAVQDVASAVGWSARHLRSVFAETVGLSPKRFARIVRIRHAVRRLQSPNPPGLAALALDSGFCDQAHMTREFQALLGEPPAAFFQRVRTLAER